jgi:hypothetical protein
VPLRAHCLTGRTEPSIWQSEMLSKKTEDSQ